MPSHGLVGTYGRAEEEAARRILGPERAVDIAGEVSRGTREYETEVVPQIRRKIQDVQRKLYQQGLSRGFGGSGRYAQILGRELGGIEAGGRAAQLARRDVERARLRAENVAERQFIASSLLGARAAGQQIGLSQQQLVEKRRQFEKSKPKWYDYLLSTVSAVAPIIGGAIAGRKGGGKTTAKATP